MLPGDVVNARFAVTEEVSAGGMGRIFRARDLVGGGDVALKIVHLAQSGDAAERFTREALLLGTIRHPGVVRYLEHGVTDRGERYLAMEWLDGVDLAAFLKRRRAAAAATATVTHPAPHPQPSGSACAPPGSLPVADVLALARRVAAALAETHRLGIIHRDLKPANLFLPQGQLHRAKVIDFGAARVEAAPSDLTATGMILGTPAYLAPEQARAERVLTAAVDVWALGCVLFQCLVGEPPIRGRGIDDLLARIAEGETAPLHLRRPDLPARLTRFVDALRTPDVSARPPDGSAVLEELAAVEDAIGAAHGSPTRAAPALTTAEQRVRAILWTEAAANETEPTPRPDRSVDGWNQLDFGAGRTPADQVLAAAGAALDARARNPALRQAIALARVDGHGAADPAQVTRVLAHLGRCLPGSIWLDGTVGGLLDTRFAVHTTEAGTFLVAPLAREAPKTLLGRPTRSVGRRREFAHLQLHLEDAWEERRSQAVLVIGPAGIGKSRLKAEWIAEVESGRRPARVLVGRGEAVRAGSPFAVLASALRPAFGIDDADPVVRQRDRLAAHLAEEVGPEQAGALAPWLGELMGIDAGDTEHESLRAARRDPQLLNERLRNAWETWLTATCARTPTLLVLDDLHWGDLPSVRFVDAALQRLDAAPFFVLALARPELHTVFPAMWRGRRVHELRVDALAPRAAGELVRQVLPDATDARVDDIIRRSTGNPFFLEELIRSEQAAGPSVPDTVIAVVQARLDAFGPEARRVLRAASVFGESFWDDGVRSLVGEAGTFDVDEWLRDLVEHEVIEARPTTRIPQAREYAFRHALVRDAAYAMLTPDDHRQGHWLAGLWLERAGGQDALVLAEQFELAGRPQRAVPYLVRSARHAFEGGDVQAAHALASRADQAGADAPTRVALRALQAQVAYWQSDYAAARAFGEAALDALPRATSDWYSVLGTTLVACARLGDQGGVDRWFARATAQQAEPDAANEQLIALARGTFQLVFHGRFAEADRVLNRVAALAASATALDALTRAQIHHVRGVRAAYVGDVGAFLTHLQAAVDGFAAAGDLRNVALERTTLAWCHAELGDDAEAERLCRASLAHAEERHLQQASTYARVNLGYILTERPGCADEAHALLTCAIAECAAVGNRRLEGWASGHLAALWGRRGDPRASAACATRAIALLDNAPGLQAWALATHARALLAEGDPAARARACADATQAVALLERLGGLLQGESLPRVVLADALAATGQDDAARTQRQRARDDLVRRADRLPRADWRARFLAMPAHQAILRDAPPHLPLPGS